MSPLRDDENYWGRMIYALLHGKYIDIVDMNGIRVFSVEARPIDET